MGGLFSPVPTVQTLPHANKMGVATPFTHYGGDSDVSSLVLSSDLTPCALPKYSKNTNATTHLYCGESIDLN